MDTAVVRLSTWLGRSSCAAGLLAWSGWLAWRIGDPITDPVGAAALLLELIAFAAAVVVTVGLGVADTTSRPGRRSDLSVAAHRASSPHVLTSAALGLDPDHAARMIERAQGSDDTGEVAWARHGLGVLAAPTRGRATVAPSATEAAWSVFALDGLRRMLFVVLLIAVLFTGRAPFGVPSWRVAALLVASQLLLAVGHWLLSERLLRPGARLRASMASVGAGFGDGVSRTGLPIRWAATMATMVALNVTVALRGLSDRWTHGLGSMPHDERVAAMSVAVALVVTGLSALRSLPQPELGFYGATRRLEEGSTRRLALGATLAVAVLGFTVGVLPGGGAA